VLIFSKTFKLYVFKDKGTADLTIKVTDNFAQTYHIPVDTLQEIVDQFDVGQGWQGSVNGNFWLAQQKYSTPRTQTPNTYVRISVYINGVGHQYRIDPDDMLELRKDLFYQRNNPMYWD
jgi:hypothetical protein